MKNVFYTFLILLPFSIFSQSPFLVEEEFDNAPSAPTGWTLTGLSSYTSGTMSGKSANALKFDNTGDQAVTKNWGGGADQITFVMRGSGTPASDNMLVEIFNGSTWNTLANAKPRSTARVFVYNVSTSITQARFTYTKSAVNVELDDFTVRQSGKCSGTAPYLTSINIDACGSGCEGRDEFFTFLTGSTAMNLSDIEISYPDANSSSVTWCGNSATPCDNYLTTNSSEVTSLNTLAGCNVFLSPGTSIPAYSPVMVFNGNGQNTRTDFSSLCSGGSPSVQYYALFANNTSDCNGRFGNYTSTASCTPECYRGMFLRDRSTGCTDTNYYSKDGVANADGGSVTYGSPGASPVYQATNCNNFLVLPLNFLSFYLISSGRYLEMVWETAQETNLRSYIVEQSVDGRDFRELGRGVPANTLVRHTYHWKQESSDEVAYYRIAAEDYNGSKQYSNIVISSASKNSAAFKVFSAGRSVTVTSKDIGAKTLYVCDALGKQILCDSFLEHSYTFESPVAGILFLTLVNEQEAITKKVFVQD